MRMYMPCSLGGCYSIPRLECVGSTKYSPAVVDSAPCHLYFSFLYSRSRVSAPWPLVIMLSGSNGLCLGPGPRGQLWTGVPVVRFGSRAFYFFIFLIFSFYLSTVLVILRTPF